MGSVGYDDRLVPLGEWPGTKAAFSFESRRDSTGTAALELTVTFQGHRLQHKQSAAEHLQVVHDLTYAISSKIAPVFMDQAGMGDLDAAQARFRESLLVSLCRDFAISAIVQVPAPMLAAAGSEAALGTSDGEVYVSHNAGSTWARAAGGLPSVLGVALV